MQNLLNDVREFHLACDVPAYDKPEFKPERADLRRNILSEEARETDEAIARGDMVEIADGLADVIYVAVGTALEFGIPLDRVWQAVHAANMAKVDPITGKVRKREDGKVLKPEGWTAPDIHAALYGKS